MSGNLIKDFTCKNHLEPLSSFAISNRDVLFKSAINK